MTQTETSTHAPAPWKANGKMLTPAGCTLISAADGYGADVAYVPDIANVPLIEAAPMMREALRDFLADSAVVASGPVVKQARDAIAKATGAQS